MLRIKLLYRLLNTQNNNLYNAIKFTKKRTKVELMQTIEEVQTNKSAYTFTKEQYNKMDIILKMIKEMI